MTKIGKLSGRKYPDHWDVNEKYDKEENIIANITCSCGDSWTETYFRGEIIE